MLCDMCATCDVRTVCDLCEEKLDCFCPGYGRGTWIVCNSCHAKAVAYVVRRKREREEPEKKDTKKNE